MGALAVSSHPHESYERAGDFPSNKVRRKARLAFCSTKPFAFRLSTLERRSMLGSLQVRQFSRLLVRFSLTYPTFAQTHFWAVREYLAPVLRDSKFKESGRITPAEFVAAGDFLVYKFPTWRWEAGQPAKRREYLPAAKQYLVSRNGQSSPARTQRGSLRIERALM